MLYGMSKERFTLPVSVFMLLIKDGKVLLHRRMNTGWYDGSYDMPSGHINGNESLATAVCREAREEIGIIVADSDVKFVAMFHGHFTEGGKEYIYTFLTASRWQGQPKIMEPEKCDDLRWFDINNLPGNLTPGTQLGLQAYRNKTVFIESGL